MGGALTRTSAVYNKHTRLSTHKHTRQASYIKTHATINLPHYNVTLDVHAWKRHTSRRVLLLTQRLLNTKRTPPPSKEGWVWGVVLVGTITIHRHQARTQSYAKNKNSRLTAGENVLLCSLTYITMQTKREETVVFIPGYVRPVDATHTVHLNYYAPDRTHFVS